MTAQRVLDSYARESRRGDKRNLSIAGQHERNLQRIQDLGCVLGEKLQDKGKSAWQKGVVRPDWERMAERLEDGESDGVVIYDLERLMRSVEDALRIVKIAEHGLEKGFLVYDSDLEYDLTSPAGQAAFYNAAVAGAKYSHLLSGKVTRGNRQKALNGEGKRGRFRAFGFEDDSTTVRESEREHIRKVDRMIRLEGKTWGEAIAYLASQGIYSTGILHSKECTERKDALTPYQQKSYECDCPAPEWQPASLKTAMTAPRMAGYTTLGKQLIGRLPGEPILDPADWQDLRMFVSSRRGRPPMETALCAGDVPVHCANCTGILAIRDTAHGKTYRDAGAAFAKLAPNPDQVRRRYNCQHKKPTEIGSRGCGRVIADELVLDKLIGKMVIRELSSVETAKMLERKGKAKNKLREPIEKEIVRLEGIRDHWDNQLNAGAGGMTPERHTTLTDDINARIKSAQQRLSNIGEAPAVTVKAESKSAVTARWDAATSAEKRKMLRQAFGERTIYVVPGSSLELEPDVSLRIKSAPMQIPPNPQ
ncbi:recombinase family protein [Streptomyces sp. SID3212]|uniref:recombinase family protein n=1 Tax=Streptomyces sp. SID3212 TaxID=2690259 RepID=UPI00136EA025|nr:recombinase family protein [Streptomyces sp. SID3212]MYV58053.1 recombinase family protein [Streptomyces sp. SID3212]